MRNSNSSFLSCETISRNNKIESANEFEVIDLTNEDDDDDDCVLIETNVKHVGERNVDGNFKIILHEANKVRRCLSEEYDMVKVSYRNSVDTIEHPVVRCGFQDTLSQEIPGKQIKCEPNNQYVCEDKSTCNNHLARPIINSGNKNTNISKKWKHTISNHHKTSKNYKKGFKMVNKPDEQAQSELKLADPSVLRKDSSTSSNKPTNHPFQLKGESSPKIKYSSLKSINKNKRKMFSTPQKQVGKGTLLDYFKPLSSSVEKTVLPSHSQGTNILLVPQAIKENSHTKVELEQQNNQLTLHNNEDIIHNCKKNCLNVSVCDKNIILKNKKKITVTSNKSIQNHSKETENKCISSKPGYINITSNTNNILPETHKRNISPTSEKAFPRKKKRIYLKKEMKVHTSIERLKAICPDFIPVIPMKNVKVKKQAVKDFQPSEQTFCKQSVESTSCSIIQNVGEKTCPGDKEIRDSKLTTECNITESENQCLEVVEEMLNRVIIDVESSHKLSKCRIEASCSQSINPSGKNSQESYISSSLLEASRNKSFNEENVFLISPTKNNYHSGDKKQTNESYHFQESKCDKDVPSFDSCSNTKYNSEIKESTELNLKEINEAAHVERKSEKSVSTLVNADINTDNEIQTTIIKSQLIGASSLTKPFKNCDQTIHKESFGESDRCDNSSLTTVNTSREAQHSGKKISVNILVSTMKKIFSEQFCHPWFLFDTSGIPTCCSLEPYDFKQFNILCNIDNMIQLDLPMLAVDHFTEFIFSDGIPDALSVQKMLHLMLETNDRDVLYAVQSSIISLLSFYPPCFIHSASYYREVFDSQFLKNNTVPEGFIHYLLNKLCQESDNSKDENFLSPYVNKLVFEGTSNSCEQERDASEENFRHENCVCRILLILSNIRYSLASDFSNWIFKHALDPKCNITKMITQPLIATAIWPRSANYHVGVVKGVICLLVKCCVKLWSFKNLSVSDKSVLLELLHMAAEVTRFSIPIMDNDYPFFGPACDALAREVYSQLNLHELDGNTRDHFLKSLKPDWLAMKIGNILIADIINSDTPLVLSTMVSFVEEHFLLHKSGCFVESCPNILPIDTASITKHMNVNKPDAKGEVMLHVASRKGNIEKVKLLLNNPHIRVNAQDYAGWTPLQEAIVKSRIDCIEALLNYDPPNGERVDTSLADFMEGRTPLMTAALYNNLRACQMLLKHSGSSLLQQKDKNGQTVFDYVQSEELKNFLFESEHKYKHIKKRPTIKLNNQCWKNLEPILPLTIFKYLITYKIIDITETLKCKRDSKSDTIINQENPNSENVNINVNAYQYKRDYAAYRVLQKLTKKEDSKSDFILDKLRERFLWYHIHVIDNSELDC